jgi:hypothetical protein
MPEPLLVGPELAGPEVVGPGPVLVVAVVLIAVLLIELLIAVLLIELLIAVLLIELLIAALVIAAVMPRLPPEPPTPPAAYGDSASIIGEVPQPGCMWAQQQSISHAGLPPLGVDVVMPPTEGVLPPALLPPDPSSPGDKPSSPERTWQPTQNASAPNGSTRDLEGTISPMLPGRPLIVAPAQRWDIILPCG